jgi:hypothetical protein
MRHLVGRKSKSSLLAQRAREKWGPIFISMRAELWLCYLCATHGGAICKAPGFRQTGVVMASETTKRKDTMKVEKLSLLVLTLCIVVLVYVLVAKPF